MKKYPLPTPQMFVVHDWVVAFTQIQWTIVEQTAQSFADIQRTIGNAVLPVLNAFAEELEKIDPEDLDDEQE